MGRIQSLMSASDRNCQGKWKRKDNDQRTKNYSKTPIKESLFILRPPEKNKCAGVLQLCGTRGFKGREPAWGSLVGSVCTKQVGGRSAYVWSRLRGEPWVLDAQACTEAIQPTGRGRRHTPGLAAASVY